MKAYGTNFLLMEDDPNNKSYREKSIKYLTNTKKGSIMKRVSKSQRKDNKMTSNKTNKSTKKIHAVLSLAWLVEAAFRGFVGWILLANFDHMLTTVAAFYALGTAGVIVVTHFVRAYK